jgi:hypothetical protein
MRLNTSSFLGPNILLSTLSSILTVKVTNSFKMRDQVSHPYKTTDKIIYILILAFLDRRRKGRIF